MPKPEGYRKALRIMKLAEKFGVKGYPAVFVDDRASVTRRIPRPKADEQRVVAQIPWQVFVFLHAAQAFFARDDEAVDER